MADVQGVLRDSHLLRSVLRSRRTGGHFVAPFPEASQAVWPTSTADTERTLAALLRSFLPVLPFLGRPPWRTSLEPPSAPDPGPHTPVPSPSVEVAEGRPSAWRAAIAAAMDLPPNVQLARSSLRPAAVPSGTSEGSAGGGTGTVRSVVVAGPQADAKPQRTQSSRFLRPAVLSYPPASSSSSSPRRVLLP